MAGWLAFCPALVESGVATWGLTEEEAMKNLQEVSEMVLADMVEVNDPIPEMPEGEGFVSVEPRVVITA